MASKVLPITINTIVECNLTLMFQFSILQSSSNHVLPWLVSKYTNIQYDPVGDKFELIRDPNWFPKDKVFYRHYYSLKTNFKDSEDFDLLAMIRSLLEDEQYVNGAFDSYYVPTSDNYGMIHCIKNYLIYGYNDDQEEFYILSYTNDYNYDSFRINYSDFIAAVKNRSDNTIVINGIKIKPDFDFSIRMDQIHNGLYDYLNSCHREEYLSTNPKKVYGKACLDEFKKYLHNIGYMSEFIRRGSCYSIHDYQKLMCLRTDCLIKSNMLPNDMSILIDELNVYSKDFKKNCELFNTTRDITVLKNIIDVFEVSSSLTTSLAKQIYDTIHNKLDQNETK